MKRFQLLTTAIFLFCTLLIAGCTSAFAAGIPVEQVKIGYITIGDENEGYSANHLNGLKEAQKALGIRIGGDHAGDVGIGGDDIRQMGVEQKRPYNGQKASAQTQHRLDKAPVQAEKHADQNDGKGCEINGIQASFLL